MQSEVCLGSPHFDLVLGVAWKREMECVVQGVETPQEGVLGMIRDQRPLFCDRTV